MKLLWPEALGSCNDFLSCCLEGCRAEPDAPGSDQPVCKEQCIKQMHSLLACELAAIRRGGLRTHCSKRITWWVMRIIPQSAGGWRVVNVLLRLLAGVSPGSVRQLLQTTLKRFNTTNPLPRLQRPRRLATQTFSLGPPRAHMFYLHC